MIVRFDGEFARDPTDAAKEFVITAVELLSLELSRHVNVAVADVMNEMVHLEEMEFAAGLFFGKFQK